MYEPPLSLGSGAGGESAPDDERAGAERSVPEEGMERLVERTLHESIQRAGDLKKLSEMLTLMLQRLQVQALRIESDLADARAERSRLQRELAEYREQAQLALWEVRQRERDAEGVRQRVAAELEAERQSAKEDARRIRAEAEREAAELLAGAQQRRTELLSTFEPWWQELTDTQHRLELPAAAPNQTPEAKAEQPATAVVTKPPASEPRKDAPSATTDRAADRPAAPATREPTPSNSIASAGSATPPKLETPTSTPPERPPAAKLPGPVDGGPAKPPAGDEAAQDTQGLTEVVFLRVSDARGAAALQRAVGAISGVLDCRLREFERGRLVLDVEHRLGGALADRIRGLESLDLRQTQAREGRLEFQCL